MKRPALFRTLSARLLATYLALILLSLGVLVLRVGTWLDESRLAETHRDQQGRAILAASATEELLERLRLKEIDLATFKEDIQRVASEISQPITILDLDGQILVDTEDALRQHAGASPEILVAAQGRIGQDLRFDDDEGRESLFTASPIWHDKDQIGTVRIELPMSTVRETSLRMWTTLGGAAALAALGTTLVSLLFARSLVRPIRDLERAASRMAGGDLKQRIDARGPVEMEQLARGFNFMAERLSGLLEDQRAFVADAAHELRTPLTTIRLRAEALREGAKDDAQLADRFLGDIESETERLARLANELLVLSRIETGLIEPRRELVSIKETATQASGDLMERIAAAGLELHLAIPDNLPQVRANPDEVRRVFTNLIDNAIKFTPTGGMISVQASLSGGSILCQVTDTGVGVKREDLSHIFDRFYRSDKSLTRDGRGSGLGLAIVKSIVDAHAGRVWAESQMGKGTTISFSIPVN